MSRWRLPLVLAAAIAGCASHGATGPLTPGQAVALTAGREVALPAGGRLRFVGVTDDSRCPVGVQCIHAGSATAAFELRDTGVAEAVSINTADRLPETRLGPWRLRLLDLGRGDAPRATIRIDPAR